MVRREGVAHITDVGGIELSRVGGEVVVKRTLLVDNVVDGRRLLVRDGRAGRLALDGGHGSLRARRGRVAMARATREDGSLRKGEGMAW